MPATVCFRAQPADIEARDGLGSVPIFLSAWRIARIASPWHKRSVDSDLTTLAVIALFALACCENGRLVRWASRSWWKLS